MKYWSMRPHEKVSKEELTALTALPECMRMKLSEDHLRAKKELQNKSTQDFGSISSS